MYQNGKKEQVTLFLFDHILIICKKVCLINKILEFIKTSLCFIINQDRRNSLIYFGRADLDNSELEDLIDGKGKKRKLILNF